MESVQLDIASIHYGVHSHSQQVDHHLDKDVLFNSHIARHVRIHIDTKLDTKLLRIVVCHAAHLIEAGTDIDALKHRLCKVVLRHIVDVLEISDAVPGASHHRQAIFRQVKLLLVTASLDELFQVLTRQVGVIIDQAHHVLGEFDHVPASVDKLSQCHSN